ncbi:MAG: cyoA [Ramlibacter sp.]|nr:cyoA [Ramlibacter sp.]
MAANTQVAFSLALGNPMYPPLRFAVRLAGLATLTAALAGCDTIVMKPHGDIAMQQANLIWQSVFLMLIIIVPVMVLILLFAFRYRHSGDATYTPDWDHSTRLELLIWGAPLLIVIALGTITWISTHKLDPYRPLDRINAGTPITSPVKPLVVDVVALDWKWLFIYPEEGIATINEVAAPVNRPIEFHITASTVMNTFYVPALAGMVYAMPGMEIQLHAVMNDPGSYQGLSANYSGAGFSDMKFKFLGLSDADYANWVNANRQSGDALTRSAYLKIEQPSARDPVHRFGHVDEGLYPLIVNRCVDGKKMCIGQMMHIDANGGMGKGSVSGLTQQDLGADRTRTVVAALCTPANPSGLSAATVAAARP